MNPHKYAFKNYIFDFYGTLVDIETDESSPILWDTMAQIYQSYGASYSGEGLRLRYRELVQQAEEDLAKEKQVAYPEIDLTVIFVQLYLESHPSGNSVSHLKDLHNHHDNGKKHHSPGCCGRHHKGNEEIGYHQHNQHCVDALSKPRDQKQCQTFCKSALFHARGNDKGCYHQPDYFIAKHAQGGFFCPGPCCRKQKNHNQ